MTMRIDMKKELEQYYGPMRGLNVNLITAEHAPVVQFLKDVFGGQVYFEWMDDKDASKAIHLAILVNKRGMFLEDNETGFNKDNLALKSGQKIASRIVLTVEDPFAIEKRALENGATSLVPVAKQFWGSHYGLFRDLAGIEWAISDPSKPGQAIKEVPEDAKWNLNVEIGVDDCEAEIEWVKKVFDGKQMGDIYRSADGKKIMHACVIVNNGGAVMLSDKMEHAHSAPKGQPEFCVSMSVPAGKGPEQAAIAEKHGAKIVMPVEKQYWGSIYGRFVDPFGLQWSISETAEAKDGTPENHYNCQIKDFDGIKILGKRVNNLALEDMKNIYPQIAKEVTEFANAHKDTIHRSDVLVSSFHSIEGSHPNLKFNMTIGFKIGADDKLPAKTPGDVKVHAFPGIEGAAHVVHRGPYDNIKKAWDALESWGTFSNLSTGAPAFEIYSVGPAQASSPAEYVTEIYKTVRRESKRAKRA